MIAVLAVGHADAFGCRDSMARVEEMVAHAAAASETSSVPMTLIALVNGELAGSCRICADDFGGGRPALTPWLATLFVLPTHRGKGVGSALANGAASEVKGSGDGDGLYLWACDREVAAGMYTKLGWVVVEETVPPADHDCDLAIIMKRDL
jgi:GNAT superfamily N-acetyltransferase